MRFFLSENLWTETEKIRQHVNVDAAYVVDAIASGKHKRLSLRGVENFLSYYHNNEKSIKEPFSYFWKFLVFPKIFGATNLLSAKFLVNRREVITKRGRKHSV